MEPALKLQSASPEAALDSIAEGLSASDRARIAEALAWVAPHYAGKPLSTGEPAWPHAIGLATRLAASGADLATRIAGVLFAMPKFVDGVEPIAAKFGAEVASLAAGVERLYKLRVETRSVPAESATTAQAGAGHRAQQSEVLRKMVLAMVEDVRVVLLRLASRTQTLRWCVRQPRPEHASLARESLEIYSPLANRLGVWKIKWELEDLAFRMLEPATYQRIAGLLDEKRIERERYIAEAITTLATELRAAGVLAEVLGRPKHLYSIWNKMRAKSLEFSDLYDVRALRVIVDSVAHCYTALGVVHNLWQSIPSEFDDYISRPKGNDYQSLHTAVIGPGERTLEVQIRTREMHRHAELGVAAHWRYKESGKSTRAESAFDDKIAWLRQLLAWRDEVAEGLEWTAASGARPVASGARPVASGTRPADSGTQLADAGTPASTRPAAASQPLLDDTIFVLTPQGRVIDLPAGATPIDFAYTLHTDIGHRCRGAKVDGHMATLDTALKTGQRVEIVAAKSGGPSRDWLNAERGFAKSHRARAKIRQWFNTVALAETIATGRDLVEKEIRRERAFHASLDVLAVKLGFVRADDLFAAAGRDDVGPRAIQVALRELSGVAAPEPAADLAAPRARPDASHPPGGQILIVGMDRLLTQLAKCCKPLPPDPIRGFVTRGRGVSIHRADCASLAALIAAHGERVVSADWGQPAGSSGGRAGSSGGRYPAEMLVTADDRQGLLRDIGDALAREKLNVTAVRTQTRGDVARMRFAFEIADLGQFQRAIEVVRTVSGVVSVARG